MSMILAILLMRSIVEDLLSLLQSLDISIFDINSIMSSEDYSKKTDKLHKELNTIRKDINYSDEQ